MGRYPQPISEKGSKKWVQRLINDKPEILNKHLKRNLRFTSDDEIQWRSPLKEDDYAEYRDQDFIDRLGVVLEKVFLRNFWPTRGPQWDALGRSSKGNIFLVEAKSHIPEMISTLQAKDSHSLTKIHDNLKKTKSFLNAKTMVDWSIGFYQYTNRLAHLYLLRELNQLPAYLLFIYFINDSEMKGPTTTEEWKGAIHLLHSYLGSSRHKLQRFISDIFIDVDKI